MNTHSKQTIVIAGAGYAGLAAARSLGHANRTRVILINQYDYHLLQFQLHEAAVNKIETESLALPLTSLLPRGVELVTAKIERFDFAARTVHTDRGHVPYDRLIIALGSQPATFNIPGLSEHALMLKTLSNAQRIRGHLEVTLSALKAQSRATPYPLVIGGAGITGVELAAELSEGLKDFTREYDLDRNVIKIVLIEAAPTVLPGFDRKTIDEAARVLTELGIDVRTSTAIERVEADRVVVKANGVSEAIDTQTVIWTGGVKANALVVNSGLTLGERGAAVVDEYLRSIDYPEVSVVGDNALVRDPRDGRVAIPCGQLAAKQGKYAGQQILADLSGDVQTPYVPLIDGLLISLGSYRGVGTIGPVWVRRLIARLGKIGAETRYLFTIGGVKLVAARGLLLRHEWVALIRKVRSTRNKAIRTTQHATR
ncbi:MAG TPA: NAD(P)/FAD-dependent oxidoreductase [Anaerolineae bacterium]|nr:NAD(P)/FAD-dependent oxidoreductase [Anaerolineae bacterium]